MTGEREINYEGLVQKAMRGVVRTVLADVAKSGLPGDHHFYIAFKTDAPGVSLSKRLKEKYPEEMTVVLQHRFWDLIVTEDRFEVKLTFDSIPERLSIPFDAVKVFFDPSVPYGLQFEDLDSGGAAAHRLNVQSQTSAAKGMVADPDKTGDTPARAEKKPRTGRRAPAEKTADRPSAAAPEKSTAKPTLVGGKTPEAAPDQPSGQPKVVSIDAFRKK